MQGQVQHPPAVAPLPVEVLDMIFQYVPISSMPAVLRCTSLTHSLGCRTLYRDITNKLSTRQIVLLLKTLSIPPGCVTRSARLSLPSTFVRTLQLDLSMNLVSSNLLRLMHRALSYLAHLRDLHLEFSLTDSRYAIGWVLTGCTAQLERFSTSVRCDATLSHFLETQKQIRDLSLRGFQLNDVSEAFALSPRALPHLSSILVVHAGAPVLKTVIEGRPIEHVGVTLFREDTNGPSFRTLDALTCGTRPLRRLTLLILDDSSRPDAIIQAVATRMPDLEALHVVVLFASYSVCNLFAAAAHLGKMHQLKYLTFMAGEPVDGDNDLPHTVESERRVVGAWGSACPSLRTVILPKGQMWYEQGGKWLSSGE